MVRHNNQLPHNLPQLQNLIKRDPESYKEEFLQQYEHYKSHLQVFSFTPNKFNKSLDELVLFVAQVSHCYPDVLKSFPQEIITLLETHNTILDSEMRMTFCKALIQLRNKGLVEPTVLLSLFFQLLKCQDKALRQFLQIHIITDIKNINAKQKNSKVNTVLQNFMFSMLKDTNAQAAKMSIDILVELYKKNIWNDIKTVNVIVTGCFSKIPKVMATSLKFFLGSDVEDNPDSSDSDDEPNVAEVMMANKVNKKTKKREKQLKKVKQLLVKSKKKKSKAPIYNFSALHLVHDPQGFAEKLFKQLTKNNDRFEIKLMTLDVISRLVGLHNLMLFTFYPYIQRFLQPHQRDVTKLLQFVAQASHELVPPDILEPVLKTIVNNFVTERNSADVMAIGLNAVREMCVRCPLIMNADLLQDLAQYKHYKERSVMMAARSLISMFRHTMPSLLHKKDRGRPTEETVSIEVPEYGKVISKDFVPGAEILSSNIEQDDDNSSSDCSDEDEDDEDDDDDDDDDDGEWIDVSHDEDEDSAKEDTSEVSKNQGSSVKLPTRKLSKLRRQRKQQRKRNKLLTKKQEDSPTDSHTIEKVEENKAKASEISVQRILSDADFKKIEIAMTKKQVTYAKSGNKRPCEEKNEPGGLVSIGDIENIYKKRKLDKAARLESIKKGQEGRPKFGYKDGRQNPLCSKTNREKKKTKAYQMIKHKLKGKVKKSFKEKQIALRNHLLKQKRMK